MEFPITRNEHDKDIERLERKIDRLDEKFTQAVNHLSQRLPAWGTAIIATLTSIVGWLVATLR